LICTKHRNLELELISDLQDDRMELLYQIMSTKAEQVLICKRREVRHRSEQLPQLALPLFPASKMALDVVAVEDSHGSEKVLETKRPPHVDHVEGGG
jgi:hypothetical protein